MFKKFFRPKWQHEDPAQRLAALKQLSPTTTKGQNIIEQLCKDPDPQVQKKAISLCNNEALLDELSQQSGPETRWAQARRIALLSEQDEEALNRFIRTHSDAALLSQFANSHDQEEVRHLAVRRLTALTNETALAEVAQNSRHPNTRLQAAQALTQPQLWRELQKHSRDKAVQQWVREQLRQHQEQQQEAEQQAKARHAVLEELKQHQHRTVDNLYSARLAQFQQQWAENSLQVSEEENEQYHAYVKACEEHLQAYEEEKAAQAAREHAKQQQGITLEDYQSTLTRFKSPEWEQEYGRITAALTLLERQWQQLSSHYHHKERQVRFAALQEQWQDIKSTAERYFAAKDAENDASLMALREQWPATMHLPSALLTEEETETAVQQTPAEEAHEPAPVVGEPTYEPQKDKLFFQLRSALRRRNLRHANRLWLRFENEQEKTYSSARAQRFQGLSEALKELQDWHNFAAEPKKEALCERMEALIEEPLDPEEKANAIQALHHEWRELMSSDQEADQALWDRFKAASDAAYEPCREHFKELDAERAAKLEERQALCAQLDALLEKTQQEEAPDWHGLFTIRRQAPEAYFAIEPVRYTDARETDQRFSQLLKQMDETLARVTKAHIPLHEALIETAQGLAAEETPNGQALRELQQQWRALPWLHPRQYRRLHKRFRSIMDAAFANINEQREQAREQHAANKAALEEAMRTFKAQMEEMPLPALKEAVSGLQALPCPPREKALAKERDTLVQQGRERIKQWPLREQWQALVTQIEQAPTQEANGTTPTVVIAIEALCEVESPEEDKTQRFEWQLEQLPKLMKQGQSHPVQRVATLLQNNEAELTAGLASHHQARILKALSAIKP